MLIAGSVYNTVKLAQLDEKWQKKKENSKVKKEELSPEMKKLMQYQEDMERIREGNQMSSIDTKLKSGVELTPDEIAYLKKNRPESYQEYEEIKREKEAYKNQLKICKTKEEVEKVKLSKMGHFMAEAKNISQNPYIPKAKKLKLMEKLLKKTVGVDKIHTEFTKSQVFRNLPTEEEQQEEKRKKDESVRLKITSNSGKEKSQEEDPTSFTEENGDINSAYPEATFEETKKVILDYIIANREIGGALEYIDTDYINTDFEHIGKKKNNLAMENLSFERI